MIETTVHGMQETAEQTNLLALNATIEAARAGEAVTAMKGITETIESVNSIAASVAAAMEEQQSATEDIARSIQRAAEGTNEVSVNITGVSEAATGTTAAANTLMEAARPFSDSSDSLQREVESFLSDVRAAESIVIDSESTHDALVH